MTRRLSDSPRGHRRDLPPPPYLKTSSVLSLALATLAILTTGLAAEKASAGNDASSERLELQVRLRLLHPTTHLLEVEITAGPVREETLDFVMPAWSPGRYAIYDFAKNAQEFEATGAQGQQLHWTKMDKQTWRVETRGSGGIVRARYKVFANDLNGTFSQFDTTHANVDGGSVYMYVAGHKQDPLTLTVEAPQGWKLISGFSESTEQRSFTVASYDLLIDTPLEISSECSLEQFVEHGKTIRVAVHSFDVQDKDRSKLLGSLQKIVRSEMAEMPEPDFHHYTFIFHFAPDISAGDGMEHLNSTQVIVRGSLAGGGLGEALETGAHEFFHVWNVKRLRPAALGPFDYTRENYTRSLWFAEGVTSYCAYWHLLRSGAWTREDFLKRLGEEIRMLETGPGRALMSAESSSFHAWFYDRSPQMQETNFANSTISYYNKGALLGLLLDLEVRSRTGGQKTMQDVIRSMYQMFYEAPAAGAYGRGQGYEEEDILKAMNSVSGSDFTPFFDRYVRGTEPLPYAATLALAGLALRIMTSPDAAPSLGVLTQPHERGVRIMAILPGRAADRGGLSRDDLLIEVDELPLAGTDLRERLKMYTPGAEVPFTVERHGRAQRILIVLDPPAPDQYSIEELPNATAQQVVIRNAWLKAEK